jgi:hypothetical protein
LWASVLMRVCKAVAENDERERRPTIFVREQAGGT